MPKKLRQFLTGIYTVFFILFAVVLVANSFGYRLNTKTKHLEQSSTTTIRTAPMGAQVEVMGSNIQSTTPADLTTSDAGAVAIAITKDGFKKESFSIALPEGSSLYTNISNLYLVPTNPSVSYSVTGQLYQFLSETELLIHTADGPAIATLTLAGIQKITPLATQKTFDTKTDFVRIGLGVWLSKKTNSILLNRDNTWSLLTPPSILGTPVAAVGDLKTCLLLTQSQELWSWNYDTEFTFVEKSIRNITYLPNPDSYWLWKANWIQKIDINKPTDTIPTKKGSYASSDLLWKDDSAHFFIQPVYQGYALQTGNSLYYLTDANRHQPTLLSTKMQHFTTAGDTVYWIENSMLTSLNLRSSNSKILTHTVPATIETIHYDQFWNRLFVFTDTDIYTTWHDNDQQNNAITEYPLTPWLHHTCYPHIDGGTAYCYNESKVHIYINRSILL